jgi:anion-transporting  ArsA/GET3 family ATPase
VTQTLGTLLADRRICICVGAGGVGKTTTSAAIALGLAARGRRVALVTIDPSRRLTGALALSELTNEPQALTREHLLPTGLDLRGEVCAMVLDPKETFDELVRALAPDERTRERVLSNRIYRELSSAVAGSHEFTAMAKLYELDRTHAYDAIVLDTPPSRNTLDVLRAPDRLMQFFDARTLRVLLAPAGVGARLAGRAGAPALALLRHLVGVDLLGEIALFLNAINSLIGGFRERAAEVSALLRDPGTAFVLVSTPESEPVRESIAFAGQLRDAGQQLGGLVVNRYHPPLPPPSSQTAAVLTEALGERLASVVVACAERGRVLEARDAAGLSRLQAALGDIPRALVPLLESGLGELETLGAVASELYDTDA